uniref:Uncharacterized protein n=1 Tax=Leersia perrieri TaxID=77586 RepID=A0A0D9XK07_9ORYZ
MASSPSDPAPLPAPLMLPAPPEPAPLSPPPPQQAKPTPTPTVADNFRSLLKSTDSLIRFAFRGNSGSPTPRPPPPHQQQHHHHNRPAEIMKRVEKLSDMMKLMDGHEQIDRLVALYNSSAKGFHLPELPVRVKVALDAAGALLLVDSDELEQARDRLAKASNTTGLSSRFVFESTTRRGKDTVAAELATGAAAAGGRPLEMTRLQYCAHVGEILSLTLVPFGAQCNNFLHGSSLIQGIQSRALTGGPPSFSERHDCGAGLSIKGSRFRASMAELIFGSPPGEHEVPNRLTTFGKVSYETADDVKLSLSGLWQVRPPSSRFSDLGALAVPLGSLKTRGSKTITPSSPPPPLRTGMTVPVMGAVPTAPAPAPPSSSSHTVAVMVDCDMYETLRAEGWVEVESTTPAARRRGSGTAVRWGFCVSECPEHELGWGVRIGGAAAEEETETHRPHVEGFLSFDLGKGGRLQPGLVIAMDGDKRTPALVLRSSWLISESLILLQIIRIRDKCPSIYT